MVLFKIKKGQSSRIDLETTAFEEGVVYLTTDEGAIYFDVMDTGEQKRIRVGPTVTQVDVSLSSESWLEQSQTVDVSGMKPTSNGVVGLASTASVEAIKAAEAARLYISEQGDGTLTIKAMGVQPTTEIPISVLLY